MIPRRNTYPGPCATCTTRVGAHAGYLVRTADKWGVVCIHCHSNPRLPARAAFTPPTGPVQVVASFAQGWCSFRPENVTGELAAHVFAALDGAPYDKASKQRRCRLQIATVIVARLQAIEGLRVVIEPELAAALQALAAQASTEHAAADERAAQVDARLRDRGLALFPFQRVGASWLAPRDGAILADDMGLGKTIQALCAAPEGAPVIVVCPSVAKGVWLREAHKWRPDLTPVVLSGRASFRWPRAGEMIVANYDILSTDRAHCTRCEGSGTVTTTTGKTKGCDCVVLLDPPLGCVLIADEAHAIKNTKAARTQKFRAITKRIRAAHGRVWLITATPILNRPMELWALLSTISRAKQAFGSWQAFVATFGGKEGRYGVEFDAKKINVARVTARLQEVMLRRMKTDVLKELPAKTIEILDVELDTTALRNLDAVVRELAAQGIDLHKALRAARTNQGTELKEIARARAILAMGKVAAALDLVGEIEEAGEPLVVFSAHRGPVDILGAREGWAAITGDTTPAERTQIEEAFQAGKLRGVAGTIAAAGVAITLTRAAAALFIDPAWTPALNAQAEDRIYRIGQARPVTVTYLRVAHAVDEAVFACLDIKRAIITNTVDAAAKEQAS